MRDRWRYCEFWRVLTWPRPVAAVSTASMSLYLRGGRESRCVDRCVGVEARGNALPRGAQRARRTLATQGDRQRHRPSEVAQACVRVERACENVFTVAATGQGVWALIAVE